MKLCNQRRSRLCRAKFIRNVWAFSGNAVLSHDPVMALDLSK
jgi:hypothetical protein